MNAYPEEVDPEEDKEVEEKRTWNWRMLVKLIPEAWGEGKIPGAFVTGILVIIPTPNPPL